MDSPSTIVIATDFSPAATAALSLGAKLAALFKVKVILVHVFIYTPKHRYRVHVEWMVAMIRKDVEAQLEAAKAQLLGSGIDAEIQILEGAAPGQLIIDFVQSCVSPMLIMGTHAFGGIERFLLGSIAEQVLRGVRCPVITVNPLCGSSGDSDEGLKKILFATDCSPKSLAAVPHMLRLREASQGSIRVLHVSAQRLSSEEESNRFAAIRAMLSSAPDTEYITLHGSEISQAVVNEAERYRADIIVLGVQHGSEIVTHMAPKLAFQIVAASPCAVLTVSS